MNAILAAISRLFSNRPAGLGASPRGLLERAGADAGRDPAEARELRSAAVAYLRVVR